MLALPAVSSVGAQAGGGQSGQSPELHVQLLVLGQSGGVSLGRSQEHVPEVEQAERT